MTNYAFITLSIPVLPVALVLAAPAAVRADDTAKAAQKILAARCSACHGNTNPQKGINVLKYTSLQVTGLLKGDGSESTIKHQVDTGAMPADGTKLSKADIAALDAWIAAGAPDWDAAPAGSKPHVEGGRKQIAEGEVLKAIVRDLQSANERKRAYLRYYSLVNLYNNPDISEDDLNHYRSALGKLLNSLSWERAITKPAAIDANHLLLRIDLRDFDWSPEIWQHVIAAYPYGLKPRNISGEIRQIQDLCGATLPYVRADWFITNASLPPLYNQILQLPDNVPDLERKLGVDSARDVEEEKAVRAGVRDSGVSRNNRVVERHRALYGAYWKSFDFADNIGEHNIFKNPVSLHPAGGEFIFNLPNGLQGYFLAKGTGEALADGPTNIVRDIESNRGDDPVVHNGRSCMACHVQGMRTIRDEVRRLLTDDKKGNFDVDKARALYVSQKDLEKWLNQDSARFREAVVASGSDVPESPKDEPINRITVLYQAQLTVQQAAADAGLTVEEFQRRIGQNSDLRRLGFDQLEDAAGGIKRDAWEEYFGQMVEAIGLGDYLAPSAVHPVVSATAGGGSHQPASLDPIVALQRKTMSGPVHITLSLDKGVGATYKVGETVGISFTVDRDCRLALYDIDPAGVQTLLFPNQFIQDDRLIAGQTYHLQDPAGKNLIEVLANGTFGVETLLAVASRSRADLPGLSAFKQDPVGKSLGVVGQDRNVFAAQIAGNGEISTAVVRLVTSR
jgi:mono/diheme cytochrome c family protein